MALIGEMQYLTIGGNTYSLPSGGGGSVSSVAVSNATNGGLSVSGSPISSSGTITVGHSNVLSSAQTTQAVYPIKIDKNGHISAYGTAVTIPTVNNATLTIQKNGTTVNSFTANASSNVTANITVPTKTSELTNDSGYITNAGVTGVKGNSESSYRTGQVNLTAANIGAIPSNSNGNTQNLLRPLQLNGLADNTLDAKINTLRANRLAFLPADQIIIEKTTDGGSTWTDAGVSDATKVGLFSETRAGVSIPLLNGVKNINCGLRITITGMKYNVPSGTAETSKYNYWNSNYIVSTERYNQLKEMYFWVSANSDTISVKVERATGAASTTWNTIFDNSSYGMTGWSGNDYIRFAQGVFGGGTNQTSNYWNYRLTFFTRGPGGSTTLSGTNTTSAQSIQEIRGYGDTWLTAGNEYAANDKIYTHDYLKNVTFPAKVTATGGFSGALTGNVTGNVSGTAANVTGTVAIANGGTGQTTAANAINALLNGLPVWTADPTDTTYFVSQDTGGSALYGKVAFSTIWNYISGKLPAWSKASSKPTYTASEVGALASNTTYVSTITTTAGTHSAISSKSGAVSFNVPTKTSHLTNDSGYLTGITSSQVTTALGYTPYNSTNPNGYTSNTGTVTKVIAGTGLSIGTTAGGNFTTSGTINHTNSVTAQTTQAVYPIKIDAQGHISGYGSAVTSMPASDVSSWAKASSKPSYTASEVGAAASSHAHGNITSGGDITATAPTIASGDQLIINDDSASKVTNGPTFDGSTTTKALSQKGTWETFSNSLLYGTCTDTAATVAKTVTVDSSFKLVTGATVAVKFTYTNSATNPTLNVNSTGAKAIKRYGTTAVVNATYTAWNAEEVVPLLYDGTNWLIMNNMAQNNMVSQNYSTDNLNYNMALSYAQNTGSANSGLYHSDKIKGNPSTGRITTADLSSSDIDTFVNSLNYSQINAVDYVVEQGTSGSWHYRKWNSGLAECWLPSYNPGSYTCGTARGSLYSGGNLSLTFPVVFTSYPAVTGSVSLGTDAYVVWLQFNGLGTTTAQCRIVSSGSVAANSNYLISVHVTGRWK